MFESVSVSTTRENTMNEYEHDSYAYCTEYVQDINEYQPTFTRKVSQLSEHIDPMSTKFKWLRVTFQAIQLLKRSLKLTVRT